MLSGFRNGFVKEAAALAALVVGIWGAIKFSAVTTQTLYDFFGISWQYADIVAFIITFVLIVIVIHFIGIIVNKVVNAVSFSLLNKILGAGFGVLKSALILSVVFCVFNVIDAKRRPFLPKEKIEQSAFYYPISDIVPSLFPIIDEIILKQNTDILKKSPDEVSI
jgi:membrane protein required for colicin V production